MRTSISSFKSKKQSKISIFEKSQNLRASLKNAISIIKDNLKAEKSLKMNHLAKEENNEEMKNLKKILDSGTLDFETHFEIVNNILRKTSGSRKELELLFLDKIFHNIKFLRETKLTMNNDKVMNLYRKLTIQNLNKYDTVFSQGDHGSHFYIILKGSVGVLIPKPKKFIKLNDKLVEIDEKIDIRKKPHYNFALTPQKSLYSEAEDFITQPNNFRTVKKPTIRFSVPIYSSNKLKQMEQITTEQVIERVYPTMRLISKLEKGDSFGELALLENCKRNATIFCLEECQFAILSSFDFKKILRSYYEEIREKDIDFLSTIPFLSNLDRNEISQVLINSQKRTLKYKDFLFKEGDPVDKFYIILDGEIELEKKNKKSLYSLSDLEKKSKTLIPKKEHFGVIKIRKLSYKQLVGEDSLFNSEIKFREESATCNSFSATVFSIPLKNYAALNFYQKSIQNLSFYHSIKTENFQRKLNSIKHYFSSNSLQPSMQNTERDSSVKIELKNKFTHSSEPINNFVKHKESIEERIKTLVTNSKDFSLNFASSKARKLESVERSAVKYNYSTEPDKIAQNNLKNIDGLLHRVGVSKNKSLKRRTMTLLANSVSSFLSDAKGGSNLENEK